MTKDILKKIYEQMPEPRLVIAIGACALGGGVMKGCYNTSHGVDKVIPVNLFIPGCPPRPEAILYGILKLVGEEPKGDWNAKGSVEEEDSEERVESKKSEGNIVLGK
jgi:NADH:ubiquinone oxidoreductase subunit B-like Fe-S oxidoreductase